MEAELLTEREVAALLQLDMQTLQHWRMRKQHLNYIKIGHAIRYPRKEVQDFIERSAVKVTK